MSFTLRDGKFSIENYDRQKCFSSFLPGIAGKDGVPMWVFYVNRGQGIASFGIENKDKSIMEFKPADQSYTATPLKGFRTFMKLNGEYYEAFSSINTGDEVTKEMIIDKNNLEIVEINKEKGIKTSVSYYTMPSEAFSALVRTVKVKNIGDKDLKIDIADGLPEVLPSGISNTLFKEMGFTGRAWMQVFNTEKNIPFFSVRTAVGDIEIVEEIKSGYFYFAASEGKLLQSVYDKNILFGLNTCLQEAYNFKMNDTSIVKDAKQYTENILPSAFCLAEKTLKSGETFKINSMIGYSEEMEFINNKVSEIMNDDFIETKRTQASEVVEEITKDIYTKTSNDLFNMYSEQNYMDNVLRGGYPVVFKNKYGNVVYHIFSRKHGDLERDYNFFSLQANKYSQGNGNFRDVLQNRRNDVFFKPQVKDFNINMFMNFIQADGNNPLVVKGTVFRLLEDKEEVFKLIGENADKLEKYLSEEQFTPGEVLSFVDNEKVELRVDEDEFIQRLLYHSKQFEQGVFGEGYWVDHWTYLMDLVDSYVEIYPDKVNEMLFAKDDYRFFDSPAFVRPRKEKYRVHNGKIMQLGAVEESHAKEELLEKRAHNYLVDSKGEIYKTNLFSKLLLLATTKFSTLDPFGMGLEMEANKPGWNDALNGLPGMLGSGMSEAFELKRLVEFLRETLEKSTDKDVVVFSEFASLINEISELLDRYNENKDQFAYWNAVADVKETYRAKVFMNIDGDEEKLDREFVLATLDKFAAKLNEGIAKAKEYGKGIYPTYFSYKLSEYETEGEAIIPKKFELYMLPYFLEGPTRAFKVIDEEERFKLYDFIKKSDIYDKKLKMYKTSESIAEMPNDIGRLRAFTPGWLENESIFMHMEFKYLLELIKGGLAHKFYEDIKTMMPPYMDYKRYGRSILENSSFIVSSANGNENLHGQGFSARLSGSTAEFLSMWKLIFAGKKLFTMEDNELNFTFKPQIEGDLFDEEGIVEFKLFSKTKVRYVNPSRKSTFGKDASKIVRIGVAIEDQGHVIEGDKLTAKYAEMLRNGDITNITCFFE